MAIFQHSTFVPATADELFRFHENPANLRATSPPGLRILEISAAPQARVGEEFRVAVQQGPLTLRWTGRWDFVQSPQHLVDVGVQCPFRHWRHEHLFTPAADGALLTDRVEFRLPWYLGGPLGDLIIRHLVMPRMFAARHRATHGHFTYQKSAGAPTTSVPSSPLL